MDGSNNRERVLDPVLVSAVEGPGTEIRDDSELKVFVEKIAHKIVSHGLTAPAIFFLESVKPLHFLSSQVLLFSQPFAAMLIGSGNLNHLTKLLESRQGIEMLILAIEAHGARGVDGGK